MGILRELFGPSKEEIWQQLSAEINGRYVAGGFWTGDKVEATHGQWTITLDVPVITVGRRTNNSLTRMRAPYVNPDGFRFMVYRRSVFSEIAQWFGMQDVKVGYEPFDHDFVIKGNDEAKLRLLFANARIRYLIAAQPDILFTVKDDEGWFEAPFPKGVDELYFEVMDDIEDLERLKLLYELFAETLDQLCHIGSAYENRPDVSL
ncbi:MAG TPA: hypothetical protein VK738_05340 [Terriglobales bacterium]|jgi:hypothetical protein|nr:hypothetical protein [Terriglobales bacterium]